MFDELGKISWLWMNSPLHKHWPIKLSSSFICPPVYLKQYLLLEREGYPVAYCSWAFFTDEAEVDYLVNPSSIAAASWSGGSNLWFVDWIAPFSRKDSFELLSQLKAKFPNEIARAIRVKKNKKNARVMEFKGRNVSSLDAETELNQCYERSLKLLLQKSKQPETCDGK